MYKIYINFILYIASKFFSGIIDNWWIFFTKVK